MLHFSEADLLETWYSEPGSSLPIMMHLAECEECAARYEKLEAKMHGLSACGREHLTLWQVLAALIVAAAVMATLGYSL